MAEVIVTSKEDLQQLIADEIRKAFAQFQPAPAKEVKYFSVKEAAKRLKCSPLTLYRGMNAGTIPSKKIGTLKKIPSTYFEQ